MSRAGTRENPTIRYQEPPKPTAQYPDLPTRRCVTASDNDIAQSFDRRITSSVSLRAYVDTRINGNGNATPTHAAEFKPMAETSQTKLSPPQTSSIAQAFRPARRFGNGHAQLLWSQGSPLVGGAVESRRILGAGASGTASGGEKLAQLGLADVKAACSRDIFAGGIWVGLGAGGSTGRAVGQRQETARSCGSLVSCVWGSKSRTSWSVPGASPTASFSSAPTRTVPISFTCPIRQATTPGIVALRHRPHPSLVHLRTGFNVPSGVRT